MGDIVCVTTNAGSVGWQWTRVCVPGWAGVLCSSLAACTTTGKDYVRGIAAPAVLVCEQRFAGNVFCAVTGEMGACLFM